MSIEKVISAIKDKLVELEQAFAAHQTKTGELNKQIGECQINVHRIEAAMRSYQDVINLLDEASVAIVDSSVMSVSKKKKK